MITTKTVFTFYLMIILSLSGIAQGLDCVNQLPTEKVVLHLNKECAIAGDSIWFKAYCLKEDQTLSSLSKVLYLEIYNEETNVFVQQKFKLIDGTSWGVVAIPESLKTGYYYLRSYTQYMRNFSVLDFHNQGLFIINPDLEAAPLTANRSQQTLQTESTDTKTNAIQNDNKNSKANLFDKKEKIVSPVIEGLQNQYDQRSLISLKIDLPISEAANLSLVVRKKGLGLSGENIVSPLVLANPFLLPSYLKNTGAISNQQEIALKNSWSNSVSIYQQKNKTALSTNTLKGNAIPEIKNVSISGKVINKKTKMPAVNVLCMVAVVDAIPQLHLAYTKKDGTFIFDLSEQSGVQDLFVTIKDDRAKEFELLINNDFANTFPPLHSPSLEIDSFQHQLIENLLLEREVQNNYSPITQNTIFKPTPAITPKANIFNPDFIVKLSDYIKIPNLQEIFLEIIPNVSIRKNAGKNYLNIFNTKEDRNFKSPIVLLDNVPVFNIDRLLKIDPAKIKNIEVFNTIYMLGEVKMEGLIKINTNTVDFAGYTWDDESAFVAYKTISSSPSFQKSVYPSVKDRTPDFRNVLYWNPSIELNSDSKSFDFYTSDMTGTYEVIVQGFTQSGQRCYQVNSFQVQRKKEN